MEQSSHESQDVRMQEVAQKIHELEETITRLQQFLELVPEEQREEIREALRQAASAGAIFQEIQRTEVYPVDAQGKVILGKAVRDHLNKVRAMYGRIDDAEHRMRKTFSSHPDQYQQAA